MKKYLFALGLMFAACGSTEEEPSIDVEACELIEQPASAVSANADRTMAPEITVGEVPYDVTGSATEMTYLRIDVDAPGEAVMFLKQANVSSGKYYFGTEVNNLPASEANENCPADIPDHYHVEFSDAGTYAIELNPIASKVTILIHPEEEGEHDH
jgi:hypothetical protein